MIEPLKQRVIAWLRVPDVWEASRDIDEWRRRIAGARTAQALIALFA